MVVGNECVTDFNEMYSNLFSLCNKKIGVYIYSLIKLFSHLKWKNNQTYWTIQTLFIFNFTVITMLLSLQNHNLKEHIFQCQ